MLDSKTKQDAQGDDGPSMRLDKWLKVARLIKTRARATKACEERRVKVNGRVAKPAKMICEGDVITIRHGGSYRTFDVLGVSHRSVAAVKAQELYHEHKPKISEDSEELLQAYLTSTKGARQKSRGRPTKRERRKFDKMRGW